MTNVQAAAAEAFQVAKAYNKITDGKISFKIPLFRNMPEERTQKPKGTGNPVNYLKSLQIEDYEFAPIFQMYQQKYSLIVENKVKKVNISAEAYTNKAKVEGDIGEIVLNKGMNKAEIKVTAENGLERIYTIYIFRGNSEDADFENAEEALVSPTGEPTKEADKEEDKETTPIPTKEADKETTLIPTGEVDKEEGKEATPTPTKKADKGESEEKKPTPTKKADKNEEKKPTPTKKTNKNEATKKPTPTKKADKNEENKPTPTKKADKKPQDTSSNSGDVNGDGKVSVLDLLKVRKTILGVSQLSEEEKNRADVNGNGRIDIIDLLRVQKRILGIE